MGYALRYPADWEVRGQVLATDFAAEAQCESVEVIDFEPAAGAGSSAELRHSFVQICAKRLVDEVSLEEFIHNTYRPDLASQFDTTQVGAVPAFVAHRGNQSIIFVQTASYRMQIVSAVVAEPEMRATRRTETSEVISSFTFNEYP